MGLIPKRLRAREQRLPLYRKLESPTKARYSSDDGYSTVYDSEPESPGFSSPSSSRHTSGSLSSGFEAFPKTLLDPPRRTGKLYPYRVPPKITRYIFLAFLGLIVIFIGSLVRASQVENWKVANGKVESRPPPPPVWERFRFLERYYGGIRTLTSQEENKPEYPYVKNEPVLLEELQAADAEEQEAEEQSHSETNTKETKQPEETKETEETKGTKATQSKRDLPSSQEWKTYAGKHEEKGKVECFLDAAGKISVPEPRYYTGRPQGFPNNVIGSYDVLDLPEDICFERFGRFGPYGFGYSVRSGGLGTGEHGENEGAASVWLNTPRVDYRKVNWADAQRRCFQSNDHRFKALEQKTARPNGFYIGDAPKSHDAEAPTQIENETIAAEKNEKRKAVKVKKSRTAVVVRCWDEYLWREDDIANLRSIITELALGSGGRYDIHLLVQVKNDGAHPIWADSEIYEQRIKDVIPEEFRGLVTFWTETQMLSLYQGIYDLYTRGPELPVHGVYRGLTMAMQYFAYMHPEYDYFWQWEMDVRYTGHYYDFFSKLEKWSKKQPRKGLWERNGRFYLPSVHGSWDDFSHMARVQSEMGTVDSTNVWKKLPGANVKNAEELTKKDKPIWGPVRAPDDDDWFEPGNDPVPPVSYEQDRNQWGVGEDADYISLNPMFDPEGTGWFLKDDITGFNKSAGAVPRRANIITTSRMSRRLLLTMHKMTAIKKQFAFPEMWPATVCLQHGFKAVYAPHPVYVDREWPVEYMAQTYNGGKNGATGGARTSVFGDREHNLAGLSWYYNSGFAPNLYRRWVGLKVNNDGGEQFETTEDLSKDGTGVGGMRGGEGRMCLPPMLLHPVKGVELPVEAPPPKPAKPGKGEGEAMSDPSA